MLPVHGKIECRECYVSAGSIAQPHPDWRMINDPGAWGGSEPEYLVLGFSKGATQAGIYESGRFENVAFAGMRDRLTKALRAMGALRENETADQKISDPHSNIAFGSLIRCSVSRLDKNASAKTRQDVYSCTGPLIAKSFTEIPAVISNCARKYLTDLPKSIRVVFMLGNSDNYVQSCQQLVRSLYPQSKQINSMATLAGNRLWVHLAHPSGLNGHFNTWLTQSSGSGTKRVLAQEALHKFRGEYQDCMATEELIK